ncbi:hypothetical protein [Nocardioides sp. Soil796]|uniref:hypothetical protein n=1 Tax=Nocardioides sp. Soil796 TaxID=1736412 RepID=UPI00070A07BE|nr:hypothetical protein [Nocardioides sp. Soil796]KRF10886.1 hypothetical protein ASH02_18760 [Nocardioides sp. Soil796]
MQSVPETGSGLEVSRRRWLPWLWLPAVVALVAVAVWWARHPAPLPLTDSTVTASPKVGQRVYLGATRSDLEARDLAISSTSFRTADSSTDGLDVDGLEVEAWICRDGAISQTTDPSRFCADVLPAEGNTLHLGGGDQLMLSVESPTPVALVLDPVEVAYRDGLQWGTDRIGSEFEVVVIG